MRAKGRFSGAPRPLQRDAPRGMASAVGARDKGGSPLPPGATREKRGAAGKLGRGCAAGTLAATASEVVRRVWRWVLPPPGILGLRAAVDLVRAVLRAQRRVLEGVVGGVHLRQVRLHPCGGRGCQRWRRRGRLGERRRRSRRRRVEGVGRKGRGRRVEGRAVGVGGVSGRIERVSAVDRSGGFGGLLRRLLLGVLGRGRPRRGRHHSPRGQRRRLLTCRGGGRLLQRLRLRLRVLFRRRLSRRSVCGWGCVGAVAASVPFV